LICYIKGARRSQKALLLVSRAGLTLTVVIGLLIGWGWLYGVLCGYWRCLLNYALHFTQFLDGTEGAFLFLVASHTFSQKYVSLG